MKYLTRDIDNELMKWKNEAQRKPLLLRGARQVGKSSVVKNLGKAFKFYVEVNFEIDKEVKKGVCPLYALGDFIAVTRPR